MKQKLLSKITFRSFLATIIILLILGMLIFVLFTKNSSNKKLDELERCDLLYQQDNRYPKDSCYKDVAQKYNDISLCEKISSKFIYNYCIAVLKKDLSVCNKIKDATTYDIRWDCYTDIAAIKEDLSICDKIPRKGVRALCYYNIAMIKKDISICDAIEVEGETKNWCYNNLQK